jgi:hypothetical protein
LEKLEKLEPPAFSYHKIVRVVAWLEGRERRWPERRVVGASGNKTFPAWRSPKAMVVAI